jgi:hypothetical protein
VGNVYVYLNDASQPRAVLEGLVQSQQAADIIRATVKIHGEVTP